MTSGARDKIEEARMVRDRRASVMRGQENGRSRDQENDRARRSREWEMESDETGRVIRKREGKCSERARRRLRGRKWC